MLQTRRCASQPVGTAYHAKILIILLYPNVHFVKITDNNLPSVHNKRLEIRTMTEIRAIHTCTIHHSVYLF